jgi:hypothetical protein
MAWRGGRAEAIGSILQERNPGDGAGLACGGYYGERESEELRRVEPEADATGSSLFFYLCECRRIVAAGAGVVCERRSGAVVSCRTGGQKPKSKNP